MRVLELFITHKSYIVLIQQLSTCACMIILVLLRPPSYVYSFPSEKEEEAVVAIEKLGGIVVRDHTKTGNPISKVDLSRKHGVGESLLDSLRGCKHLKSLLLADCNITDRKLSIISQIVTLEELDLSAFEQISDLGCKQLGSLGNLTKLTMIWAEITDVGVGNICNIVKFRENLKELSLEGCRQITDNCLKNLVRLRALTAIDLSDTNVSDQAAFAFLDLAELQELNLAKTKITDKSVEYIVRYPKLKHLMLWETGLTDKFLAQLHSLTSLESLNLNATGISNAGLKHVGKLHRLSELGLATTSISDAGISELGQLQSLVSLDLHFTSISGSTLDTLVGLKKLTQIDVSNSKIDQTGVDKLSKLSSIKTIDMGYLSVTNVNILANVKFLREINLAHTSISDEGIRGLGKLESLQKLDVSSTAIKGDVFIQEGSFPNLERLDLSSTRVSPEMLRKIRTVHPHCQISKLP